MKNIVRTLALLCFLFLIPQKSFALMVEISHSEAASYLHFINTAFGESFTSGSMKDLIQSNKMTVFEEAKMKQSFRYFKSFLQNGYNFKDETPNRPDGFWAEDGLNGLAASSESLAAFEKNLPSFVPYRGIAAYYEVKKEAYPLFRKYVWDPTFASQGREEKKIKRGLKKTSFLSMLEKAKVFYLSEYPEKVPFRVALIPIPDADIEVKHTSATSLRNIQIVPYLTSLGGKDSLDVIFHEFCHALYEGQSSKLKTEMNEFYLNSSEPHALFVYRYLNEVLATAWGNGWYKEVLDGKLSERSWYDVAYIDELAKGLLPLIKNYAYSARPIDRAFMAETIHIAKKIFPNAPREIAANMMNLNLLIEFKERDSNTFVNVLRKQFRIQSLAVEASLKDEDLSRIKARNVSNAFVITDERIKGLNKLKNIVDMASVSKIISGRSEFLVIVPQGLNYLIWMNFAHWPSFSVLLEKLSKLELLPTAPTVLTI